MTDSSLDAEALDVIASRAKEQLARWTDAERALFLDAWKSVGTELKRELLRRAIAQGHLPSEVLAVAEALRPLTDQEAYAACTLAEAQAPYEALQSRLWAEADPIYAWVLNGHPLSVTPRPVSAFPAASSTGPARAKPVPRLEVVAASACRIGEELFNVVGAPFGVSFLEQAVDQTGSTLLEALKEAQGALGQGIPVPVLLGRKVGEYHQYALLLDAENVVGDVVYSLYDFMHDAVVSFRQSELVPTFQGFASANGKLRITAMALPKSKT